MAVRGGYQPHILRVDLSEETITKEPLLGEDMLRKSAARDQFRDGSHRPRGSPHIHGGAAYGDSRQ